MRSRTMRRQSAALDDEARPSSARTAPGMSIRAMPKMEASRFAAAPPGSSLPAEQAESGTLAVGEQVLVIEGQAASASGAASYLDRLLSQNSIRIEQPKSEEGSASANLKAETNPRAKAKRQPQINRLVTANRAQLDAVIEQLSTQDSPIKELAVRADSPAVLAGLGLSRQNMAQPAAGGRGMAAPTAGKADPSDGERSISGPPLKRRGLTKLPVHAGTSQMLPLDQRSKDRLEPAAGRNQDRQLQVLFILREAPAAGAATDR